MRTIRHFFFSALLLATTLLHAQPENRVAIVIGVKNYKHVAPLENTLNDAMDMSKTLKTKGFKVIEVFEPQTKRQMQESIIQYFKQIKQNTVGLVFYAGHGVQVDGVNYLIPAGANPMIKADLEDQCMSMDYVMSAIEEAGNPLNIFIMDACRNNPFRSFSRSAGRGLNMVNAPKGSYVVYSTKPGAVASDGTGRNGLFTSKLLKYINTPGLNIEQVFKKVAGDVSTESGGDQRPWISSDYTDDFYFVKGKPKQEQKPEIVPVVKDEPVVENEPIVIKTKNPAEAIVEAGFEFANKNWEMYPVTGERGDCKIEAFAGSETSTDKDGHLTSKINRSEYWGGECKNGFLNGFVLMNVYGDKKVVRENILAYFVDGRIAYPFIRTWLKDDNQLFVGIEEPGKSYGCVYSGDHNWSDYKSYYPKCTWIKEVFGEQIFTNQFMSDFKQGTVNIKDLEKKFKEFVKRKTGKSI